MTWGERAAAIILGVDAGLPTETPLADRIKAVDAARPHWGSSHWPAKAWRKARKSYLARFGYSRGVKPGALL